MRATPDAKRTANSYGASHDDACPNLNHDISDVKHKPQHEYKHQSDIGSVPVRIDQPDACPNANHDITDVKPQHQHKHQSDVESVPIRIDQPDDDANGYTIGINVKEQHRSNQQRVPVSNSDQNH
jgi:hypothetical protein